MAEAAFLEDDDEVVPASKRAARKGAAARRSILRDEDEADHEHDVPPLRRSQRVRVRESMQENVDFAPPPADSDQENEHHGCNKPRCSRSAMAEAAAAPAGVAEEATPQLLAKAHRGPGGRRKPCTTQAQRIR